LLQAKLPFFLTRINIFLDVEFRNQNNFLKREEKHFDFKFSFAKILSTFAASIKSQNQMIIKERNPSFMQYIYFKSFMNNNFK